MMWFIEKLLSLLTFPVKWFWESFERYKDTKSVGKIILLFAGSLTGLVLLGGTLIWCTSYLLSYHIEWVVIAGLVIWLYAYIKSRMDNKKAEMAADVSAADPSSAEMQAQAEKGYPIMRNIMFQTLKEAAADIGGLAPRLLQEIEIPGMHYMLANGINFYQFQLNKADPRMQYQPADLSEFQALVQAVCSRLIHAGNFPTLGIQDCIDAYGNWHEAVCVDVIEDVGNTFIIQAVFTTPAYTEYLHQKQLNRQALGTGGPVPDATWNK